MAGIVRDHAQRLALDPDQRGDHRAAELRAQLHHRVLVGQQLDQPLRVVDPLAVLRDNLAQQLLIGAAPLRQRSLEIGEEAAGRVDRAGFVLGDVVDDPGRRQRLDRPDLLGLE